MAPSVTALVATAIVSASSPPPTAGPLVEQAEPKSPVLASVLSVGTPALTLATYLGLGFYLGTQYSRIPDPFPQIVSVGFPLGFGAGYAYAGEPTRGLLVGLGGCAITATGFGYLSMLGGGQQSLNQVPIVVPLMLVGLGTYGWWVWHDVGRVAAEHSREPQEPTR